MKQTKYARVAGELVRFSLPLIMSGILQQLYSWADAFIIGHAEGQMQLAAVGATTTASMFLTNTILGLTLGLSIMAAQQHLPVKRSKQGENAQHNAYTQGLSRQHQEGLFQNQFA